MVSIDHLPDGRVSRALGSMFPGLVYVTAITDSRQEQILKSDDQLMTATVRRTESHRRDDLDDEGATEPVARHRPR